MQTREEMLANGVATGKNLKAEFHMGKEHYAIWDWKGNDVFLEFIYDQATKLYPKLAVGFSVVGLYWELYKIQPSIFRHVPDTGLYFIHKARFKRHLKKAIMRAKRNC